jgi:hypothetical protein
LRNLDQLIARELDERGQVAIRHHHQVTVVVGISVEDHVSQRSFEDNQRIASGACRRVVAGPAEDAAS